MSRRSYIRNCVSSGNVAGNEDFFSIVHTKLICGQRIISFIGVGSHASDSSPGPILLPAICPPIGAAAGPLAWCMVDRTIKQGASPPGFLQQLGCICLTRGYLFFVYYYYHRQSVVPQSRERIVWSSDDYFSFFLFLLLGEKQPSRIICYLHSAISLLLIHPALLCYVHTINGNFKQKIV